MYVGMYLRMDVFFLYVFRMHVCICARMYLFK